MSEDLFYSHVGLVFAIVKRLNYSFLDQEDLIQAGLMGLHEAALRYDPNKSTHFSPYATCYIIGEIKKEIRNNRPIKLSKEMFKILKRLKDTTEDSLEKISEELGIAKENILLALSFKEGVISLNKITDDLELVNLVPDKRINFNYDLIYHLDKISQEVILLKYFKGYSQKEIAKILKISQAKVSRLEKLALNKIKSDY